MSLREVKLEIAATVRNHPRLSETTFHYPEKRCTPPGFIVALPEGWDPTMTYQRGSSNMALVGWLVLPWADAQGADDLACEFYDPEDPVNLIARIQDHRYSSCAKVMVDSIKFEPIILGDVVYLGGRNTLHVLGMRK